MKKMFLKIALFKSYLPSAIVLIMLTFSEYQDFPFMNYSSILNMRLFSFLFALTIILLNYTYQKSLECLTKDGAIFFQFHFLLIVIWLFLFFTYHEYLLSLITIIGSIFTLIPLLQSFYNHIKSSFKLSLLYMLWIIYLFFFNLLIII